MSSIFDNITIKEKCQKFTPSAMVETMLDLCEYKSNIVGKKVLENSFGSGNILKAIVKRYIADGFAKNLTPEVIVDGLAEDIYGIEYDKQLFQNCLHELDLIAAEYNLPEVKWSLYNEDALSHQWNFQFDYVIGNPPYIMYKDIDADSKKWLKTTYKACEKGKFDYCYAFIESGINSLNETGKLVQLIPNNIYKNVFAKTLRDMLQEHITVILDYPTKKIFEDALTSSSIFLYDKAIDNTTVTYMNVTDNIVIEISKNDLDLNGKWIFTKKESKQTNIIKFGDLFQVSMVVATLLNEAFLIDRDIWNKNQIENAVVRRAVSPKTLCTRKEQYIIFPYAYKDDALVRYSCETFEQNFPHAAMYLKSFAGKLAERKADKSVKWFEYGRSQALAHLNQEKLLLSTVITNEVEIYRLDSQTIPFAGIYVTVKNENYTLNDAEIILRSPAFLKYVKDIGINVSGVSKRITCKDIRNFEFVEECGHGEIEL